MPETNNIHPELVTSTTPSLLEGQSFGTEGVRQGIEKESKAVTVDVTEYSLPDDPDHKNDYLAVLTDMTLNGRQSLRFASAETYWHPLIEEKALGSPGKWLDITIGDTNCKVRAFFNGNEQENDYPAEMQWLIQADPRSLTPAMDDLHAAMAQAGQELVAEMNQRYNLPPKPVSHYLEIVDPHEPKQRLIARGVISPDDLIEPDYA